MNDNINTIEVSVAPGEGLQRRMDVTVAETRIADKVAARLNELTKTARINGFRKGKIPLSVIKRQYGDAVYADVINDMVRKTLEEAIQQQSLQPAGYPKVESIDAKQGQALSYTVSFDVYPEITLHDFSELHVMRQVAAITETDVNNSLEQLREQSATWSDVAEAAKEGDQVTIDFIGTVDDKPFAGGEATGFELILGSQSFIPGFEDQLIGAKADDKRTISVTFPEEYHSKELAGKLAAFAVTVHQVAQKQLPALDDAKFLQQFFAKDETGSVAKLTENVKASLQRELDRKLRDQLKQQVFEQLATIHTFDIPNSLIEHDIDRRVQDFQQQFARFSQSNQSLPPVDRELFRKEATKQVKLGLVLSKAIEQFNVTVDREQIQAYLTQHAQGYDDPDGFIKSYLENAERLAQLKPVVLEESLVDLVLEKAKIEEKTVSYDEVIHPQKETDA